MMPAQYILRFIDAGREIRRPPLVGFDFLHKRRTRLSPAPQGAGLLINPLVDRFARRQRDVPRHSVVLRVFSPSGKPAVRVCCR
jgi:hypothetical protein